MGRTKQTARKTVGGKAPRKQVPQSFDDDDEDSCQVAAQHVISLQRNNYHHNSGQGTRKEREEVPKAVAPPEITFTGTYDTAFYAHYFFTGAKEKETEVKCRYALAHTIDPLTKENDFWASASYNSKFDGAGMKASEGRSSRPALNLVVALDISGSMADTFHATELGSNDKKLQVAKESLLTLLSQLRDDDAFGLVLFNTKATILQPLTQWSEINSALLKIAIGRLRAGGGTDLTEGIVLQVVL